MKIFDCFMYFDEDMILDLRLNILDKYVDYFVIVESKYTHSGKKKNLNFDINKFTNFKNKIIYKVFENSPKEIVEIKETDSEKDKEKNKIMNAVYRELYQRNYLNEGILEADDNDFILISDIDEIPNLENLEFQNLNSKIIMFKQDMFYYKFNLKLPGKDWIGSRGCKKKHLKSPQWLRDIKEKKYNFYRIDAWFSKNKYMNINIINNGGWHFTNVKTPEDIEYKFKSYLHHNEFDKGNLRVSDIKKLIDSKKSIYDLSLDKRLNKIGGGKDLIKVSYDGLPDYIINNFNKYKEWIEI